MKEKNYHQFQILKCFTQTDKASALTADITLLSGLTFLSSTEYNVLPASVKLYLIFNMTFSIWVTGNQPVCFRHANANVHFCRTQNQHFHRTQTQHSHSSWTQHSHSTWTQHSNSSWTHWYLHFCSTWTQHFHSMRGSCVWCLQKCGPACRRPESSVTPPGGGESIQEPEAAFNEAVAGGYASIPSIHGQLGIPCYASCWPEITSVSLMWLRWWQPRVALPSAVPWAPRCPAGRPSCPRTHTGEICAQQSVPGRRKTK